MSSHQAPPRVGHSPEGDACTLCAAGPPREPSDLHRTERNKREVLRPSCREIGTSEAPPLYPASSPWSAHHTVSAGHSALYLPSSPAAGDL